MVSTCFGLGTERHVLSGFQCTRCIEDCATPDRIFRVGTLWSEDFVVCAQYEASVSALLELLCFRHQRKKEIERSTVDVSKAAEAARKLLSFPPEKSYFFRSSLSGPTRLLFKSYSSQLNIPAGFENDWLKRG